MLKLNNNDIIDYSHDTLVNNINNINRMNNEIIPDNNFVLMFFEKYKLHYSTSKWIDFDSIISHIVKSVPNKMLLNDFYKYVSDHCVSKTSIHPDYNSLASMIAVDRLHKTTYKSIKDVSTILYENESRPLISEEVYKIIINNYEEIDNVIDLSRDYLFDYFGLKTMERSYLLKIHTTNGECIIERPQHMLMRVSLGIHKSDFKAVYETYNLMSQRLFTHATPTLFNSGTMNAQMSSCFLLGMDDDLENISKQKGQMYQISKWGGGIGLHLSDIRANGSIIRGTNGISNGIIPLCIVLGKEAKYINQGGKRPGSIACFCKDTKVLTINSGLKNIQDINIGDLVITHKNRVKPVIQIHKNPLNNRKIYKLEVEKTKDIYVTGNHKFWSCYTLDDTLDSALDNSLMNWNSIEELLDKINNNQSCYILSHSRARIKVNNKKNCDMILNKNDRKLLKIVSITETDRNDEYVYTLGVEDDHSYTVEGLIAENCYLEVFHADIFEFCELRKTITGNDDNRARDLFLALWVCDLFMNRVKNDEMWSLMCPDQCKGLTSSHGIEFEKLYTNYESLGKFRRQIRARDLWNHILECIGETGMPYILFKDNANNKSNQKNLGTIKSSNLCVHGDTLVLTDKGHVKISDYKDKVMNVWNGYEWSETVFKKTGEHKDLIKVELSNGGYVHCTREHNFYISNNNLNEKIPAHKLVIGMELTKMNSLPIIEFDNKNDVYFAYTRGFNCKNYDNSTTKIEKYYVPMTECIKYKIEWLSGYFDMNGTITNNITNVNNVNNVNNNTNGDIQTLQVSSIDKDFLNEIRLMLQTLGINSTVIKFNCNNINHTNYYKIIITLNELQKLVKLGYSSNILNINFTTKHTNSIDDNKITDKITVVSIQDSYKDVDTYCFTEHKRGMGVFNGILTGQCAEIIEYSDSNETAVCNLASICLPRYINFIDDKPHFDYDKLMYITRVLVRNLNKIIDVNYYVSNEAYKSNSKSRPIGIGVQGLANLYNIFSYPFESNEAKELNKKIFEHIYYAAIDESKNLAIKEGKYETFDGSPFSEGKLQFDLWNLTEKDLYLDWKQLKEDVKKYGTRNSLLTALMPTAGTSQIMGCSEAFDPLMSNVFVRSTMVGEFIVINEYLINDLIKLDLWNEDMRKLIIINNGSIQDLDIPQNLKNIYKTAFEISLKSLITQSIDRGAFIDQSQSMNLYMKKPNNKILTSCLFYAWEKGLKTGLYYARSQPATNAELFGIDIDDIKRLKNNKKETKKCEFKPGMKIEDCMMCSG